MKTRKFKYTGLQDVYDMYRNGRESLGAGTALQNAYNAGYAGHRDPGVPTSLAHAAWAAGADNRADHDREVYDEMDGSMAMDVPVEDLY